MTVHRSVSINPRARLHISRIVSLAHLLRQQAATFSEALQDVQQSRQKLGQQLVATRMELSELSSPAMAWDGNAARKSEMQGKASEAVRTAELRIHALDADERRLMDSLATARKDSADAARLAEAVLSRVSDRRVRQELSE